jgi:hypothetical protein
MGKPFRTLVRSLGLADLRLHDLRHTGPSVLAPDAMGAGDHGPETLIPEGDVGGVDGTRTRDLRRDRPAF